jgi:hypothetical protein
MEHVGTGDVERAAHPVEAYPPPRVRLQAHLKVRLYIGGNEAT